MSNKIMFVEKDTTVRKNENVAEFMNNYFINITKTINLKSSKNSNSNDILELISQFNDHASIRKIKESNPRIIPDEF